MSTRLTNFTAMMAAMALAGCGLSTPSEPRNEAASVEALGPETNANVAQLAYIVSQHSTLLSAAARTAISQDFNGAPLSGARTRHVITADNVRCRLPNPPPGAPECTISYAPDQTIAFAGEDAAALFEALASAGVRDHAEMGRTIRELAALQCTVDDAAAQDTPATGDLVAGFSCQFIQAP